VGHNTEAFVGIDTSKLRNAIAIADGGRGGEVRYLGEFPATEAAIRKLVAKLAAKYRHLTFCYEAGPTGYGLYRLLKSLGHECLVVAPSLVPKKAGDRVKTNRRDAVSLAKLLRAGELTAVWVPDERHEAMRDLSRARQAKKDLQGKRQQISSLMLRLGRIYPGKTTWGPAHMKWLMAQKLEHREQRIAFEELLEGYARKASASSVWKTPSARRCPSGRSPRLSRPCRRCGGLISLRLWGCWPRSVISPAFKIRAS
jgi:transposase